MMLNIIIVISIILLIITDILILQDYLYCLSTNTIVNIIKIKIRRIIVIINLFLIPIMTIISIIHNNIM